jgi:phospho-2-dehydro-3-deoxyheptonate aldolase
MEDLPLSLTSFVAYGMPACLLYDILRSAQTVLRGRRGAEAILKGDDDRLIVVVGPCSVHDVKAALEYGQSDWLMKLRRLRAVH